MNSKKFKNCYGVILHGYGANTYIDSSYFPDDPNLNVEDVIEYVI